SDRCIPICHYYSRMGNGCQHLRHTIFKIRGHTPNTWHTARVRHIASCSQPQHTARQHAGAIVATRSRLHAANNRSTWNHSRQHPTPPTRGTTVANNTWNPIPPSSRGGGWMPWMPWMPWLPCLPWVLCLLPLLPYPC